jgi:glutamate 5-kinase
LVKNGKSLLPIGVTKVIGTFHAGDLVLIKDQDGKTVARGLTGYSSEALARISGRKTSEIAVILGSKDYDEVVHRDNMVVLAKP